MVERLQKILARGGIASRRHAELLIRSGRVRVNGSLVNELGIKVDARYARIEVDGQQVQAEQQVYLVLYKPRGVVATMHDPQGRPTVADLLSQVGARAYPIGRLDYTTSGVLLATNDGDFAYRLLHPRQAVPKVYRVKVHGHMKEQDLEKWCRGVRLEDGITHPAKVSHVRYGERKTWFLLTLTEGRNRQIHRMGKATGFLVIHLTRLSFAGISAGGLQPGEWRKLTSEEVLFLKKKYSSPSLFC
ncbi:hypothetical protein BCY86_06605 [Pajaroellobacter abortibovis]|uniref:RNA-binding S4 domain-containing protein n=2 Tax=Pajaroellobacter abortibovis TaxID=1882918 RepID=A0A1L6MZL8_9BACT|nr:hypothetical protein BCY86_06605 [Pajaroellobacter abortibovis]